MKKSTRASSTSAVERTRYISRFFALVAVLAVATACGDTPTTPHALSQDVLAVAADRNEVVISASGGGKITGPPGQDRFTFHARKRADGTVTGKVKYFSTHFQQTIQGYVVCMAWRQSLGPAPRTFLAIGTDAVSPDPTNTGPFFVLSVIDGGEGANAPPDKMLPDFLPPFAYPAGPPADPAEACEAFGLPDFLLDIGVIDAGNIQVKP